MFISGVSTAAWNPEYQGTKVRNKVEYLNLEVPCSIYVDIYEGILNFIRVSHFFHNLTQ